MLLHRASKLLQKCVCLEGICYGKCIMVIISHGSSEEKRVTKKVDRIGCEKIKVENRKIKSETPDAMMMKKRKKRKKEKVEELQTETVAVVRD